MGLLGRMGITSPERAIDAYPHEFSGGMRQRVMLAMGFGNEPSLLIADEPTTALDVTIQAQILDLLRELNADFGAAILLISHDLGVIANVCARVVVMYAGEVVEEGTTAELLSEPHHPYTWALLNAAPRIDRSIPGEKRLTTIEGAPPDPLAHPPGCRFAPRCPFRIEKCDAAPRAAADRRGAARALLGRPVRPAPAGAGGAGRTCGQGGNEPGRASRSSRSRGWSSTSRCAARRRSARSAPCMPSTASTSSRRRGETVGPGRRDAAAASRRSRG